MHCALLLLLAFGATAHAQSFDVAAVRPHDPSVNPISQQIGGRFTATLTLKYMIQEAYNLAPYQVTGGPAWVAGELWDINARADGFSGEIPVEALRPMLRELIHERFALKLRPEKKELAYFALLLAKGGPKLKRNEGEPFDFHREPGPTMSFTKVSMAAFATWIEPWIQAGRRVVDKTELSGEYDFTLQWTPDFLRASPAAAPADEATSPGGPAGPSIFIALQEQLGLRLEARKGLLESFVVEQAVRPGEN